MRSTIDRLVGAYGREWTTGILSEHVHRLPAGVEAERVAGTGEWVVTDPERNTYPVLCSELIEIYTEDGRITGRCGLPVDADGAGCEGHAEEIKGWLNQSEAETIAWERERA